MYRNPILDVANLDQGDPSILRFQGMYYLYHSGRECIRVYESENLVEWKSAGVALQASRKERHWAQIDLWAPEVIYANGTFYLYVAGTEARDGRGDDEKRRIGVAVASSPTGPFEFMDQPLALEWSIDAHPFKDADGTYYMFYNVRNELTQGPDGVIGCGNVVDKMRSLIELEGRPSFVCKPEFPWECNLEKNWYWNEGSFTIRRLGTYYQMYSGGCFYQSTYHLAYATSPVCRGPGGLDDRSWIKWPGGISEPILRSNEEVWGPGHHVVTKGPNAVQDYVVYHAHVGDDLTRTNYIDPLYWHGDCLYIDGPTAHERPGPFLPRIFQKEWMVTARTILTEHCLLSYLWEFWWELSSSSRILLAVAKEGELALAADPKRSSFEIHFTSGNAEPVTWDISGLMVSLGLDFSTPHLFRVIRNGEITELFIDDVLLWRGNVVLGPSTVGLEVSQQALLRGVILTGFFRDSFSTEDLSRSNSALATLTVKHSHASWRGGTGSFTVQRRGLRANGLSSLFRPLEFTDFELQVDMAGQEKVGVYPVYLSEQQNIRVELDLSNSVLEVSMVGVGSLSLREAYRTHLANRGEWQHLRIYKFGQELIIYVNETKIAQLSVDLPEKSVVQWCVGVFAENNGRIDNVSVLEIIE